MKNIYVWIFENGVEFEEKPFRLPAGDSLSGRKPASQTQARWVSRLVDRLSVVD